MNDPARMAEEFGIEYEPEHERVGRTFRKEGDLYLVGFPPEGVMFSVERLDIGKEVHGLLRVTSTMPATPPVLFHGRQNFVSTSSRASLVKYLNSRYPLEAWGEMVEQMCGAILDAIREGEPVIRITEAPVRDAARFRIDPLCVEGFPNVIFGPGGSMKSTLGAMFAIAVHGGWMVCEMGVIPGPTLVCDWELDAVTYREVAEKVARGFNIELPDFHYRRCAAPLVEEASAIGRFIAREGIQFIVIDSLGYAIGGDKTSQELTMKMFAAIRQWGVTTLCIDHVAKEDTGPFGSVYTINSARSLWRVRASQEEGSHELEVALFQTKANFGPQKPVGFHADFYDDCIEVRRKDVRDMPDMPVGPSVKIRTALLEARRALNRDEIADATGLEKDIVSARLNDMKKRGDVVKIDQIGALSKWALKSERDDE